MSFHIKQYIQVFKIIFGLAAAILIISILLNKKPGSILAGLGAMTAVLMLVFKDSILSLVASIQISAYKLIKVGDWITVPGRGIDGDVMDISLNTIKIRNFDKTISTIPTYSLTQESFVNWSGMQESGGRRISRSIYIDMNTIKLCNDDLLEKFKKIHYISDYVSKMQIELDKWNKAHNVKEPYSVNGRSLTNIGVFRKYVENYLVSNFRVYKKYKKEKFLFDNKNLERFVITDPENLIDKFGNKITQFFEKIDGKTTINNIERFILFFPEDFKLENDFIYKTHKIVKSISTKGTEVEINEYVKIIEKDGIFADDMTLLIRQLAPTEKGLPINIYVFTSTTVWTEYETIQSDLFDHIFAVLPEFELRVFQDPSSVDFQKFLQ